MISANDPKEKAAIQALQAIAKYANQVAYDNLITIDEKIKTLQWIYRKIPEINRLLIHIKTKEISK